MNIDNRIVKASFRENPVEERKLFSQSSCLMPISVGQAIHEGAKFAAVIKLINANFKECTILVDDTVQRHTIGIANKASPEELYQMANDEGEDWLKRNKVAYQKLSIPYQIMRWDDWYNNPSYENSFLKVKKEYDFNIFFKEAIHENIRDFLTRYFIRYPNINVDKERAFSLCLNYLIEECAVMCLWVQKSYDFEVYPSGRNQAMGATYKYLIAPEFPNLLKPVALRFKKNPVKNPIQQIVMHETVST